MIELRDYLAVLEADELREMVVQLTQDIIAADTWRECPTCYSKAIEPRLEKGVLKWVCLSCENFEAGI